jgi:enoyl-CoA hydratase
MLNELHAAFDRAAADDATVLLRSGREGIFSAGFDLKVFASGNADAMFEMGRSGAELALKLCAYPGSIVTVCSGHAFPMGAFLILASDIRIGVEGPYRIGFNEVTIGLPVPGFALELGRHRLAPAWLYRTAAPGAMFSLADSVAGGFLDQVVPEADLEAAVEQALEAAARVHKPAQQIVKRRLRGEMMRAMRKSIDDEVTLETYQGRASARPKADVRSEPVGGDA